MKRCPICNSTVEAIGGNVECWIECENCGLETKLFPTKEDLIKYWNNRQKSEIDMSLASALNMISKLRDETKELKLDKTMYRDTAENSQREINEVLKPLIKEIGIIVSKYLGQMSLEDIAFFVDEIWHKGYLS